MTEGACTIRGRKREKTSGGRRPKTERGSRDGVQVLVVRRRGGKRRA